MTDAPPCLEVWAAPGHSRTITLTEPPPFAPGPENGRVFDARIERDAAELWQALRAGLPIATLVQLREHFRTWRPGQIADVTAPTAADLAAGRDITAVIEPLHDLPAGPVRILTGRPHAWAYQGDDEVYGHTWRCQRAACGVDSSRPAELDLEDPCTAPDAEDVQP